MGFGDRIREKRKKMRWSQAALAAACGWDQQSRIANYENEKRSPSMDDLRLIAEALEVSPEWIAYGSLVIADSTAKTVPLLTKEQIRHWISGREYPATIKTLLSVSEKAFAYRITDPAADGVVPFGAVGLFDPAQIDNLRSYKLALISHNGELSVKQITYDSGVLFFTGGLLTIQGNKGEVVAPLVSLPEVTVSAEDM